MHCRVKLKIRSPVWRQYWVTLSGGMFGVCSRARNVTLAKFSTIMEKALLGAFSWLKAPSSAFTFKCSVNPQWVDVKLGYQGKCLKFESTNRPLRETSPKVCCNFYLYWEQTGENVIWKSFFVTVILRPPAVRWPWPWWCGRLLTSHSYFIKFNRKMSLKCLDNVWDVVETQSLRAECRVAAWPPHSRLSEYN